MTIKYYKFKLMKTCSGNQKANILGVEKPRLLSSKIQYKRVNFIYLMNNGVIKGRDLYLCEEIKDWLIYNLTL